MAGIHPHFTGLAGVFLYQQEETDSIIFFFGAERWYPTFGVFNPFSTAIFFALAFPKAKKGFPFQPGLGFRVVFQLSKIL